MNDMELHNIKANFSSSIREIDHIFVTDFVKDNFYSVGMDQAFMWILFSIII